MDAAFSEKLVFSIGYQGKSIVALCAALTEASVELLVDVRERAWSNRPEYRKTALAVALRECGIRYVHCRLAGNPSRPKGGEKSTPQQCEAAYRNHLNRYPDVVDLVHSEVEHTRAALFCYEKNTNECHRGVLLEQLCTKFQFQSIDLPLEAPLFFRLKAI
ncbi:MAG: DUF488 family protein [Methyloceanibacter sp.]